MDWSFGQGAEEPASHAPIGRDFAELRDSVRAICRNYTAVYWRNLEEKQAYPAEFVGELTAAGYLAALVPEDYGGSGLSMRAASVIVEEINSTGCSAGVMDGQLYLVEALSRHGTAAQKQEYLPEIAVGNLRLQSLGLHEDSSGADPLNVKTTAVRSGGRYVISGRKRWAARALQSDLMILVARAGQPAEIEAASDGLSLFLLDLRRAQQNGVKIQAIRTMVNDHMTEVDLEDVSVPAENLIGTEGDGFRCLRDCLTAERILAAAKAIGDARFFLAKAAGYANERIVFKRPIGKNQGIQFPIARAYAEVCAADAMVRVAGTLFDDGKVCDKEASIAKLLASEACWRAADATLQTHGGFGYAREYDVERKWREARLFQIAPISTNLILSNIGEQVLGMPRSF